MSVDHLDWREGEWCRQPQNTGGKRNVVYIPHGDRGFSHYSAFGAWFGFCSWIFYHQYAYLIAAPNIKISPITFAFGIDLNFELPRGQLPTRVCGTTTLITHKHHSHTLIACTHTTVVVTPPSF